eukprot:CAMPEP_0178907584 /NCGR_PEP_ID=MMETSP0786-20121207/7451_1 /TAXON_ID=186022 /ORGANISM="Thalassionema frauenfeldii, Strain CCMP 1798" /LENGTH=187 /DNA_ID=CAMNT_0020579397 /DNA_START=103 /DNA_END=666 /DNA_ORIENTATION=+
MSESSDSSDSSDSSSEDDSLSDEDSTEKVIEEVENKEEMLQIRQKAFDLLNNNEGEGTDERGKWPENPGNVIFYQFYQNKQQQQQQQQQQQAGEQSSGSSSMHYYQNEHSARVAEKLSVSEMFVNCVSSVFQTSTTWIYNGYQSATTGYHYCDESPALSGAYGTIDTSQHGYGKNKSYEGMVGRYQD